ncbi:GIY-YIG nuclease family protein [bacterium 210820-DFI.6.37]|nr:GIY-YIG nuclease family protein [bacterium 210820-DFI.6.37]
MEKQAYVYILKCRDKTLYTGWTNNVEKRLTAHNSGAGAKYTRSRRPVELVYFEALPDKSAALRREAAIKKLTRAEKEQLILNGGKAQRSENSK